MNPLPPPAPGDLQAVTICRPSEHWWIRYNIGQETCARCGIERGSDERQG